MNIGLVEDDQLQRTALCSWLEEAGHHCRCFDSGEQFMRSAQTEKSQVVLLDWELPGLNGLELLSWLRSQQRDNTPVIFITSRNQEEDIVRALRRGADDYLVKPARRLELLARIEALVRRYRTRASTPQRFGEIIVDTALQQICLNGAAAELTNKEYLLACYLLENSGRLLSREELLESVWGHASGIQTRTIDTHISRLRKKLQLNRDHGWELVAIYQFGYRLDRLN